MIIVLPFCHRDAALAHILANEIARLGGCQGHEALVVASTLAGDRAPALCATLERAGFDRVSSWVLPVTVEKGWPTSPNFVFREVCQELARRQNTQPFYFMEPDVTPIGSNWLGKVSQQYHAVGQPFMGAVVPTRVMRGGLEGTDGEHMVGAGIYPADCYNRLTLLRYAIDEPWDVYCQWEMIKYAHNSPLFQHNWNTRAYRREGDQIVCSGMNHLSLVYPLREDVVLLHGCKDGSLIRLLADVTVPASVLIKEEKLLTEMDKTLRPGGSPPPERAAKRHPMLPPPPPPRRKRSSKKSAVAQSRPRDAKGRLLPRTTAPV